MAFVMNENERKDPGMLRFFHNLKLAKKILLAPLIIFIFLIAIAYGTYTGLSMQNGAIDDIYNNRFKGYKDSSKILIDITNVQADLYKILNWVQSDYDMKQVEQLSKQQNIQMADTVEFMKQVMSSEVLTEEEKQHYQSAFDNLIDCQKQVQYIVEIASVNPLAAIIAMTTTDEKLQALNKSLRELNALEDKLSKEKFDHSVNSFKKTMRMFLSFFLVAVILSILTVISVTRLILKPIKEIIGVLREVADGNLTRNVVSTSKDEIGELAQSVNQMRIKMGEAVGQAMHISVDLSDSASDSAASIEETSASLDEIASMTRQNATNTNEANQLMLTAKDAIKNVNESMIGLTRSMREINEASEQTQKIVKSIDEIAFQTNLLALNASVEAARAGEAGAGFAVVADEVRNLAKRATESARNSSNLIEDIVRKVKSGESLVNKTNIEFNHLTASSDKIVGLMEEISAASKEQTLGIDQVNTAIAGISATTQQNVGNAETLSSIMSMFKTEIHDNGSGSTRKDIVPSHRLMNEKSHQERESSIQLQLSQVMESDRE
jgi:methyl-accepting chemotaxis protein